MAAFINTNTASMNAQRNLNASQSSLTTSLQRLSSGMRINSAKDDAAGLAIADRMTSQIRGNTVAMRNANDGISLAQTAEGSLGKIGENLQRMRELAVQSMNSTNSADDKSALDQEFGELASEVTRIAGGTDFNGTKILGAGATSAGFTFQVGAGTSANDSITVKTKNMAAEAKLVNVVGGTTGTTIAAVTDDASTTTVDETDAGAAAGATVARKTLTGTAAQTGDIVNKIDEALKTVNKERATYGATQNRFESVVSNLQVSIESQSASRSRIMDTDFASETASLTRGQILQQAGTAMLAQANSLPNGVLSLLRG
ncbi:flagellin [Massilia sp. TSP1-1-2]|uniref:flagellin N-terminal helical domain-containing protein n=1 Tax=Massilia sp. TSP1-1-2 TaxID=2804649 RepID=UPI003CEC68A2